MQLKDIMSKDVRAVSRQTSLREAAQQMRDGDVGALPVSEEGRLFGVLAARGVNANKAGATLSAVSQPGAS